MKITYKQYIVLFSGVILIILLSVYANIVIRDRQHYEDVNVIKNKNV